MAESSAQQVSNYAMALDFMSQIANSDSEEEVVNKILLFFDMLFMPQQLSYTPFNNGSNCVVYTLAGKDALAEPPGHLADFSSAYTWLDCGKGFRVKIQYRGVDFGIMEFKEVKFPESLKQYLNLALSMSDVCGMAIENARKSQKLIEAEQELREEKERLEEALSEVKTLSGLLPICSHCKKIRDDSGYWTQIENYIHEHSGVEFSHSICKDCAEEHFPGLDIFSD